MEINCQDLKFSYSVSASPKGQHQALINIPSLHLQSGAHLWIRGSSGSGKTTLLKLLAGILVPQAGEIRCAQHRLSAFTESERCQFRKKNMGFVDQESRLIEHWSVLQNLQLVGFEQRVHGAFLQPLGLDEIKMKVLCSLLSGGERQRLAIARLLIQKPKIALIDEPTAHLDDHNTEIVMQLLLEQMKSSTLIVVSHDSRVGRYLPEQIEFGDLNK